MLREELDTGIPTEPTRRTDAVILTRCRDDAMPLWAATASGIEKVGTNASEEDAADRAGQEREKSGQVDVVTVVLRVIRFDTLLILK